MGFATTSAPREAPGIRAEMSYRTSHRSAPAAANYHRQFSDPRNVKHLYWRLEQQLLDEIVQSHEAIGQVLDFACGTGRILGYLRQHFPHVHGLDISPQMLTIAQEYVADADLLCTDVTAGNTPLQTRFDLITAFRFFLNAEPSLRADALRWIHTHLQDDGLLVCNFHLNSRSLIGLWKRSRWRLRGRTPQPTLSLKEANQLLHDNGFQVLKVYGYGLLYYGRHHLWAPVHWLFPVECSLMRIHALAPLGRNLLLVARKS